MIYVALLRGVNVGGKGKVEMAKLKVTFEKLGLDNVKTYINSGNVIFKSDTNSQQLIADIETAIQKDFGFTIKVLIHSLTSLKKLVKAIPKNWVNDQDMKCDVIFLWPDVDSAAIIKRLPINPEIDDVKYVPGAVIWRIDRDKATKSRLTKIVGTELYKKMSIRNPNTVRKLYELMSSADSA